MTAATHVSSLGNGIARIAVPTPFAVGRVNCYLIDDDPLTLVDTGPNSGTSLVELEAGIKQLGRRVEDLRRIVLTHQHMDHIGLAQILAERSGAEVVALTELAPWLENYTESMELDDQFGERIMRSNGVPPELTMGLRAVTQGFRAWGARVDVGRTVGEGELLKFKDRAWRVHRRPGHSPSDTVFHDEASGELIAGDHLLLSISSNPLISRPLLPAANEGDGLARPPALLIYLDSLRLTAEMDLTVVHGGHGDSVTDHRALVAERLAGHGRRADKIAGLLSDGPCTAFELAERMWGNVALTQAYLTVSEVLGHLDLLERDGRVVGHGDEVETFSLTT